MIQEQLSRIAVMALMVFMVVLIMLAMADENSLSLSVRRIDSLSVVSVSPSPPSSIPPATEAVSIGGCTAIRPAPRR